MLKLAIAIAVLGVCFGLPESRVPILDGRIVGGTDANIADYSYQLVLQYNGQHVCGAVIISPTWAVTTAHCVENVTVSGVTVRAGSSTKSAGGQTVTVVAIIIHPQYDNLEFDYDIALLALSKPIAVPNASPAVLPEPDSPIKNGSNASVTGWGVLEPGGYTPEILQVVDVSIVSPDDCRTAYSSLTLTDRMFCAGSLGVGGKDACYGDSGDALIVDGVLTGIVSWGFGCASRNYPGVYTNIPALRSWIRQQTGL